MLEANGFYKMVEVDDYVEGGLPDTVQNSFINIVFYGDVQKDILIKICDYFSVPYGGDDYILNSCEEDGRIDVQILENGEGIPASKRDIELWKRGEMTLYAATYTTYIENVTRKPFKLV